MWMGDNHGACNGGGLNAAFADAARILRHAPDDCWLVDETYVKVDGVRWYVERAVDHHSQLVDLLVSKRGAAEAGCLARLRPR